MVKRIDEHGVHLYGCECRECTKTNVECPKCGRKYWSPPDNLQFECTRCMHHWNEGNELAYQVHLAELASFDRNLQQIHADGIRLGVLK